MAALLAEAFNAQHWSLHHPVARDTLVASSGKETVTLSDNLRPFGEGSACILAGHDPVFRKAPSIS